MSEREKAALEDLAGLLHGKSEEDCNFVAAIMAAYVAGKAAGEKKSACAS